MPLNLDSDEHMLRVQVTLKIALISTGAISLFWAVYYAAQNNWKVFPICVLSILAVVVAAWLLHRAKMRMANIFIFSSMCMIVFLYCVFLDIPLSDAPRSTHSYFLVLAMYAWIVFKSEKVWIRFGITALALSLFTFFASNSWGVETEYALSHSERVAETWVHNFTAMSLLLTALWLTQRQFKTVWDVAESELKAAGMWCGKNISSRIEASLYSGWTRHRFGISDRKLVLFYQAQAGDDGKVVGAEALIRWNHPSKGMIFPGDFIPVAERSGLILEIGQWVLETACEQLVTWSMDPKTAHLKIAVNVSALQFKQSDYVEKVMASLERSKANPALLTLELTESMLVIDINDLVKKMDALRRVGVKLSLDDFGTGYSSLSYLKMLPLDQLKIDKAFVRDMLNDPRDMAIVRTVIELARSLNLHIIAEGVETEEQRQFLASLGCYSFQGYLLGKPVPISEFSQEGIVQHVSHTPMLTTIN